MKHTSLLALSLLFPTALCAQTALQQLESLAGQSIHDVHVTPVSEVEIVEIDNQQQKQEDQSASTHLRDYTPEQENTTTAPEQQKTPTLEQLYQKREEEERNRQFALKNQKDKEYTNYLREQEKDLEQQAQQYREFRRSIPIIRTLPQFSSVQESNLLLHKPTSLQELQAQYGVFVPLKDTSYRVDKIRASFRSTKHAYFLGRTLPNGHTEWRIFKQKWIPNESGIGYEEDNYSFFPAGFDHRNILNVKVVYEGRAIILEMQGTDNIVLNPEGQMICKGTNISFPGECNKGMFIECDGKLYCTLQPSYYEPILAADQFQYYKQSIITTNHNSEGKTFYRFCAYSGLAYDHKHQQWTQPNKWDYYRNTGFDYIGAFTKEGNYFIVKPQDKNYYQIITFSRLEKLHRGKKKYKSIEDAHTGWIKEKNKIYNDKNTVPLSE